MFPHKDLDTNVHSNGYLQEPTSAGSQNIHQQMNVEEN